MLSRTNLATPPKPLKTAVLFLVFNRPETTAQVFESIRKARPERLYVAGDGPRSEHNADIERVTKVRKIATTVDWPCEVKTLFRESNLGCKHAVSEAITWFFKHEEQGIILEDDCLPNQDFFRFCDILLNRYAADERIAAITGNNFQSGRTRGSASYYFSKYPLIWGWATWRRTWQKSDMEIRFWPEWKNSDLWRKLWEDSVARKYWEKIFDRMYRAEIDTWDYPWTASVWYQGGLTATPNANLVSNIGFGVDATHTVSARHRSANASTHSMGQVIHTKQVEQDQAADRYLFDYHFGGFYLRFPWLFLRYIKDLGKGLFRKLKI